MPHRDPIRIGMLSTFPPTQCGIARFADRLSHHLEEASPAVDVTRLRVAGSNDAPAARGEIAAEWEPASLPSHSVDVGRLDGLIVQHEYGIYGPDNGRAVAEFVTAVTIPVVSILHTVLTRPSLVQRAIVRSLGDAGHLVVMCQSAKEVLGAVYGVHPATVSVIPHGSDWSMMEQEGGPRPPIPHIITWGLLGPGKGAERAIRSLGLLRDSGHPATLAIVGQTHPEILKREGETYRRSLERLVDEGGLGDAVVFIDRYLDDRELFDLVSSARFVVVPYDNDEQMASGVVTDALAAGKPVVATRFPYAVEMLASGAGLAVPHDDQDFAQAMTTLLYDQDRYASAQRAASLWATELRWDRVADRYAALLSRRCRARTSA